MTVVASRSVCQEIFREHTVTMEEVQQCFRNRTGPIFTDPREGEKTTGWFIARTDLGRELKIVFKERGSEKHLRTAYDPNAAEQRLYKKSQSLTGDKEQAVGPVRAGTIISIDHELGVGYIEENTTGRRFGISRAYINIRAFDELTTGVGVYFRENGRNAVAAIVRAQ